MKKILLCLLLAGCAAAIPDEPTARIEFTADESYPEGIAYDSISDVFFVSSARLGTIGKVNRQGIYTALVTDQSFKSSYGLKLHPDGNRLYACIGDANYSKYTSPDTRRKMARVVAIDRSTGEKTVDVDLSGLIPGEHFANDLTFDKEGNAYVTDSFANVIYKIAPDNKAAVFCDSSVFQTKGIGLNGIVYHPDGYLLTVSSGTGAIYKIDIKNPSSASTVQLDQFFMNGDGLLLLDRSNLVVVQNGGSDKIYKIASGDGWNTAKLAEASLAGDRFAYPSTATRAADRIWVMNANFSELNDSTAVPSRKFSIQRARLLPLP